MLDSIDCKSHHLSVHRRAWSLRQDICGLTHRFTLSYRLKRKCVCSPRLKNKPRRVTRPHVDPKTKVRETSNRITVDVRRIAQPPIITPRDIFLCRESENFNCNTQAISSRSQILEPWLLQDKVIPHGKRTHIFITLSRTTHPHQHKT